MSIYTGSCHCGRIRFEVEGEIERVLACNCSMCGRRGSLLWFVPQDKLRWLTPESDAATYLFNKHVIRHRFCAHCGIHAVGEGVDPKGHKVAAINTRVLEGVDAESFPIDHFDGRAL
jgi:hypothetical protein